MSIINQKPSWISKPKLIYYPPQSYSHSTTLMQENMYIFGGSQDSNLHAIDCRTFEAKILYSKKPPLKSRFYHSCNRVKDNLIIWGGEKNNRVCNDGIRIVVRGQFMFWEELVQVNTPPQRKNHSTTVFNKCLILMFGGLNDVDQIYHDFWVFNADSRVWFETKGNVQGRIGSTLTTIQSDIWMFGGQKGLKRHTNELIRLKILSDFSNVHDEQEVRAELVRGKGQPPQQRSNHGAVHIRQYLIILGGQSFSLKKGRQSYQFLSDVWAYNFLENQWTEIIVKNSEYFRGRSCFSVVGYGDQLIIFGGLLSSESDRISDQLLILPLSSNTRPSLLSLIYAFDSLNYSQLSINTSSQIYLEAVGRNMAKEEFWGLDELKKACRNLSSSYLIVSFRSLFSDMFLFQNNKEYYCEFDMQSSSVREAHSKSYESINKYIMSRDIRFNLLQEDSLRIVIPVAYKGGITQLRESSRREFWNIKVKVNEIEL